MALIQMYSLWLFEYEHKKVLLYATTWKAVVFLDEADVFLEARDKSSSDARRNSLVAVFLKELEYFGSIVFLTTNRLASFDRAMKSRIHLALSYGPPGDGTRRQIWEHCLNGFPAEERDMDNVNEVTSALSMMKVNGREILMRLTRQERLRGSKR